MTVLVSEGDGRVTRDLMLAEPGSEGRFPIVLGFDLFSGSGPNTTLVAPTWLVDTSEPPKRDGKTEGPADPVKRRPTRKGRHGALVPVGTIIDKYKIERLLGTGAFAAVYRANHLLLQVPVAIKMLLPDVVKEKPQLVESLIVEARCAARIDHPNLVRVRDVTHGAKLTYIVMDYVDGKSLSAAMARGALQVDEALEVIHDVALGLSAAWEQKIIHRDVKPSNIILTRNGGAKVIDLGLALPTERPRRTGKTASLVGTLAYMAPEQAIDPSLADWRSDVYSLGITLFHVLAGSLPFRASDRGGWARAHAEEPVAVDLLEAIHAPPEVIAFVVRCCSKDPASRAHSPREFLLRLAGARSAASSSPPTLR